LDFERPIHELITVVAPATRLLLPGWSMGSMVASGYATGFANRVAAILSLSPSGLPIWLGLLGRVALLAGLGDLGGPCCQPLREMRMDDFRAGYAALGLRQIPEDVLWAIADRTMPFGKHRQWQALVLDARIVGMDQVGHASQYERPDLIGRHVVDWIRQHYAPTPAPPF
jgi:pimeloyl-ACP methyl ester carboxylesterase